MEDFALECRYLSEVQKSWQVRMLDLAWADQDTRVSSDPKMLVKLLQTTPARFKTHGPLVLKLWEEDDGWFTRVSLTQEKENAKSIAKNRQLSGQKAAKKRWE